VLGALSIFETRGSELCYLLCDQTKGRKRLIANQGGTSNPPTIGRSTPAKRKDHGYAGVKERGLERFARAFTEAETAAWLAAARSSLASNSKGSNVD